MFFYLAFIANASLGGIIATTQLIAAVTVHNQAMDTIEILKGLGIDLGAVSIFAFLYSRENNAQIARLSREENLSNLKLRVDEKRTISVNALRGIARLVVVAGPGSFIMEAFERLKPFTEGLIERGVIVVPFATDGNLPKFEVEESEESGVGSEKNKRPWQLVPVNASEWSRYISFRLDGRVRGSGLGYPPWNALVAQLPPVKGMWSGLFDGFDVRV
ncbi:hypothetical protein IFM89_028189 [Coptis chinensis]|uniref:Uncharacterized protein n=1 Tax=Coptis chinensis TaxID=261450 RepID=A0A835HHT5_9MAGN|nr:hypothetical protein IFM89_028189 [Coptis chinensis]